jgi:hypothetical protein
MPSLLAATPVAGQELTINSRKAVAELLDQSVHLTEVTIV